MKSLIEYLVLFIILTIFMPSNYFTIVYIALNLGILVSYFIILMKHKNEIQFKKQFSIYNLLNIIFLILLNIIIRIEVLNLVFGTVALGYFVTSFIISLVKKDYAFNNSKFTIKYLIDIYLILYLSFYILFIGEF